jgi:hypothetical protein
MARTFIALPLNLGWSELTAASTASATIADFTAVIAAIHATSASAGARPVEGVLVAAAGAITHEWSSIRRRSARDGSDSRSQPDPIDAKARLAWLEIEGGYHEVPLARPSEKKRDSLKESKFGLPEERKYPMPDEAHARNAKARAAQNRMVALPSLRHTSPATTSSTSTENPHADDGGGPRHAASAGRDRGEPARPPGDR